MPPSKPVLVNLPVPKGANAVANLVRHAMYRDAGTTGAKYLSNQVAEKGKYMPICCLSCLIAMAQLKENVTPGRGVRDHLEVFSCMSHPSFGVNGTQCGRCLGMAAGNSCLPVPKEMHADAKALLLLCADYNKIVARHPTETVGDWTDAEKLAFRELVGKAKEFEGRVKGHKKRHPDALTPRTNRKLNFDSPSKDLTSLEQASTDTRSDIKSVAALVGKVMDKLTTIEKKVDRGFAIAARQRTRTNYLIDAVQKIGAALDSHSAEDNPIIGPELEAFGLEDIDYDSFDEEVMDEDQTDSDSSMGGV